MTVSFPNTRQRFAVFGFRYLEFVASCVFAETNRHKRRLSSLCSSPEAVLIWSFGMTMFVKTSRRWGAQAWCALAGIIAIGSMASAAELRVAVASNFAPTLSQLAVSFEKRTGHTLRTSVGSTGKLYAQIVNGAPFDVLLAADEQRPALLEQTGNAVAGTRFTYARGRLVLWSSDPALGVNDCLAALSEQRGKVAIANPRVAPYGCGRAGDAPRARALGFG